MSLLIPGARLGFLAGDFEIGLTSPSRSFTSKTAAWDLFNYFEVYFRSYFSGEAKKGLVFLLGSAERFLLSGDCLPYLTSMFSFSFSRLIS